jgi:peroxiredoxin
MKKRLSANTWVVIILFSIIGLMTVDIARSMMAKPTVDLPPARTPEAMNPKFAVGDKAPDFTLPDKKERKYTFSQLVKASKNDTLLWFTCGCAQCLGVHEYMSKLTKLMGDKAPTEINVTTMRPEREESWIRDTKLKQTILYELDAQAEGSVAQTYKGKPCPRFFHIKKDMTVAKIGVSPAVSPDMNAMSMSLARELGFQLPGDKVAGKPMAPKPDIQSAGGPPPTSVSVPTSPGTNGPEKYKPVPADHTGVGHSGDHSGHSH